MCIRDRIVGAQPDEAAGDLLGVEQASPFCSARIRINANMGLHQHGVLGEVGEVAVGEHDQIGLQPVSYTHLDVYKRQVKVYQRV